jgi:hypothetical protein
MMSNGRSRAALFLASTALIAVGLPVPTAAADGLPASTCATSSRNTGTQSRPQATTPNVCCVVATNYSVSGTDTRIAFNGVPTFKDGPGGTITVSRAYSGSATFTVTAGAESEVGAVLAKAKVSLSASLALSNSTTTTHTYSRGIAAGKYGHVQYVSWGQTVTYRKYRINSNCSTTTLATGKIKYPSSEEGWYYWETAS